MPSIFSYDILFVIIMRIDIMQDLAIVETQLIVTCVKNQ